MSSIPSSNHLLFPFSCFDGRYRSNFFSSKLIPHKPLPHQTDCVHNTQNTFTTYISLCYEALINLPRILKQDYNNEVAAYPFTSVRLNFLSTRGSPSLDTTTNSLTWKCPGHTRSLILRNCITSDESTHTPIMANLTFSQDWLTQKLKIGIDFGTTYSSVAFACTQKSHEIIPKVIPVGGFRLSQLNKVKFRLEYQVKTEIAWNPTLAKYVWGPEVEDSIRRKEILERDRITLLKLGLDDRKETGAIRARLVRQRAALPRIWDDNEAEFVMPSIEFLIAEYLKGLFVDARKYIKAKYRHLRQEDVFEASEVETVICVPAVWKAEMVDSMIRAALTAGIPNPYPVSEPDAAAAFMVVKKYENHEAEGENDETQEPFLVLDAGGGTTVSASTSSTPSQGLVPMTYHRMVSPTLSGQGRRWKWTKALKVMVLFISPCG